MKENEDLKYEKEENICSNNGCINNAFGRMWSEKQLRGEIQL